MGKLFDVDLLGYYSMAYISRMTRSLMLEQLRQEYILTARVKGMPESKVIWGHAFRNVLVQLITIIGLTYASLLEGSVLTETVFSWPGMGRFFWDGINKGDYPRLMAILLVSSSLIVLFNLVADILYGVMDPRVRYE